MKQQLLYGFLCVSLLNSAVVTTSALHQGETASDQKFTVPNFTDLTLHTMQLVPISEPKPYTPRTTTKLEKNHIEYLECIACLTAELQRLTAAHKLLTEHPSLWLLQESEIVETIKRDKIRQEEENKLTEILNKEASMGFKQLEHEKKVRRKNNPHI